MSKITISNLQTETNLLADLQAIEAHRVVGGSDKKGGKEGGKKEDGKKGEGYGEYDDDDKHGKGNGYCPPVYYHPIYCPPCQY
jgi:hypothetical protein